MLVDVVVFVAVVLLLFFVFLLPPGVRRGLEMTASSHPVTWLTSNYVHEDWDHLAGNVEGFAMCMVIYFALVPVLTVVGFDPRWVKGFSLATHLGGLVIIPVVSSLVWLHFLRSAPQGPTFGFSSSVSAYFGAYAALWALATAEALGVGRGWRTIYVELQLFLLLLTPASRYPTRIAALLTPLAQYMPFVSTMLAVLLAVRSPRSLHKFLERIPPQVKQPKKTGMVLLGLLLLPYMFYAPFILDSLYPASAVMPGTGGIVNLVAHFVGMVAGYFLTCLYTALVRNNSLYS
jgi:hypothetical protein